MSTCGPRSPMIHTLIPFLHCFKANGGQLQWGAVPSTSPSQLWRCWAVFVDVFSVKIFGGCPSGWESFTWSFASGLPGCSLGLCHRRALPCARGASTAHQWRQRGVATALRREWCQRCGSESVKSGLTDSKSPHLACPNKGGCHFFWRAQWGHNPCCRWSCTACCIACCAEEGSQQAMPEETSHIEGWLQWHHPHHLSIAEWKQALQPLTVGFPAAMDFFRSALASRH